MESQRREVWLAPRERTGCEITKLESSSRFSSVGRPGNFFTFHRVLIPMDLSQGPKDLGLPLPQNGGCGGWKYSLASKQLGLASMQDPLSHLE